MTITDLAKALFPYPGGKQHAAPFIWSALGDVAHYVEPFCGTAAVWLRRPHVANRPYYSETLNDRDGLLCNALRAIAYAPDAAAEAASWYVCEADVMARQLACLAWAEAGNLERLMADPRYCDAEIAGYWLHGMCSWIGSGYASGNGPWVVGADGRITKRPKEGGQGVNRPQLREPGVARQITHLGNDGRGVNHAGVREPGVARGDGAGDGPIPDDLEFHPMTMPELRRWFAFLSARFRHVRIQNGDWRRVCTTGALYTLPVRQGEGFAGVFLDPPYTQAAGRAMGLYTHDDGNIADDVRTWCLDMQHEPRLRIVLAGYDTEHQELEAHGWRVVEWFKAGFLRGGMAQQSANGHQQRRERLWLSPQCLGASLPMDALWRER
jgi:hypothetical protein